MTNGPENLWQAFRRMAPSHQITVLVVAVIAVVALCSGVGAVVSKIKDARFDRSEAARAEERTKLTAERDKWIEQAVAAEARAAELERAVNAKKQEDAARAANVAAADADAERIANETEQAVAAAGADNLTPDERRAVIRRKLAELGYLP